MSEEKSHEHCSAGSETEIDVRKQLASLLSEFFPGKQWYRDLAAKAIYERFPGVRAQPQPAPVTQNAAVLAERLIQAAVDYEAGRCSKREMSEARAAVEVAIHPQIAAVTDWEDVEQRTNVRPWCDACMMHHSVSEGCDPDLDQQRGL